MLHLSPRHASRHVHVELAASYVPANEHFSESSGVEADNPASNITDAASNILPFGPVDDMCAVPFAFFLVALQNLLP